MWWTGFGINYLSYSPSHRCELLARKKVGFFPPGWSIIGQGRSWDGSSDWC